MQNIIFLGILLIIFFSYLIKDFEQDDEGTFSSFDNSDIFEENESEEYDDSDIDQ